MRAYRPEKYETTIETLEKTAIAEPSSIPMVPNSVLEYKPRPTYSSIEVETNANKIFKKGA